MYESGDKVFAGVELQEIPENDFGLEKKTIHLNKYARCKHIGAYKLIKNTGEKINLELKNKGYEVLLPYIEIYGHWTPDETKL